MRKYKVIVFMDKDGNIIYDIIDPEMDMDGFNTDTSVPV